jgi:hypothetical protein
MINTLFLAGESDIKINIIVKEVPTPNLETIWFIKIEATPPNFRF